MPLPRASASPADHMLSSGLGVCDAGLHLVHEVALGHRQVSHLIVALLPKLERNFATVCL